MLILQGCTRLVEVHPSDLVLDKLVFLTLKDCKSLGSLWRSIKLEFLENLVLSGCSKLEKFPDILGTMKHLSKVYLDGTGIKELPSSIEHCTGLVLLNLRNCKNIASLPRSICELKYLKTLTLSGCSKLDKLSENMGNMQNLVELYLDGTAISQLPASIVLLKNLRTLSLRGCKGSPSNSWKSTFSSWLLSRNIPCSSGLLLPSFASLCSLTTLDLSDCNLSEGTIHSDIFSLSSLQRLNLSNNNFVSLPASLSRLNCLQYLELEHCIRLQALPRFPSGIRVINTHGCISLEKLCIDNLTAYAMFTFSNCKKLTGRHGNIIRHVISGFQGGSCLLTGSEIPEWFNHQSTGSSISFKMSPLEYSKCKAVVLCAVFTLEDEVDSTVWLQFCFSDAISGASLGSYPCLDIPRERYVESDHVWVRYCPRSYLECQISSDGWRHFEASGKIFWYDSDVRQHCSTSHKVKKCGVRIVYEGDGPRMMQYKSPQNLGVFDTNFNESTVEEEDIELDRSLDDYYSDEKEEPSRSGSLDDYYSDEEEEPS